MKFRLSTMFPKSNDDDEKEEEDATVHDEGSTHGRYFHSQLDCLFHAMVGQAVYGKIRSRELLTILNRIGVSQSFY